MARNWNPKHKLERKGISNCGGTMIVDYQMLAYEESLKILCRRFWEAKGKLQIKRASQELSRYILQRKPK